MAEETAFQIVSALPRQSSRACPKRVAPKVADDRAHLTLACSDNKSLEVFQPVSLGVEIAPMILEVFRSPRCRKACLSLNVMECLEDHTVLFRMGHEAPGNPQRLWRICPGAAACPSALPIHDIQAVSQVGFTYWLQFDALIPTI